VQETLEKCLALLKEGKEIRSGQWKAADVRTASLEAAAG
jgi:hypothetical protein